MAALIAVCALLLAPMPAFAQCDQDKISKASPGGSGYRGRGHDNAPTFCEGVYGKDVSGAVLSFIGLTGDYRFSGYDSIRVAWSSPADAVHLRAQSWDRQSFQMDADVDGSGEFVWGIPLLQSEGIRVDRIGLLGWVRTEGERLYVPLSVTQSEPNPRARYSFRFLSNARLDEVAVTLARVDSAGQVPTDGLIRDSRILPQTEFLAAEAFRFRIAHEELAAPGTYYLRIQARSGGSAVDESTVWFHHPGD